MGFHFYLYRATPGLPPMNHWEEMRAEPLGSAGEITQRLSTLFPGLRWTLSDTVGMGSGPEPLTQYLEILVREEEPGLCRFITFDKAAPSVMRRVLEAFDLNYVCAPEGGTLVDVYAYTDEDRHYAKKPWP